MAKYPAHFRYKDMICHYTSISDGNPDICILFDVQYLGDTDKADRLYKDAEKIPSDFWFRYLVTIYYHLVINEVSATVSCVESGNTGEMYLTIRVNALRPATVMKSYMEAFGLFVHTIEGEEVFDVKNYDTALKIHPDMDPFINLHVHMELRRSASWNYRSDFSPFTMKFAIDVMNYGDVKDCNPNYDVRVDPKVFNLISKEIGAAAENFMNRHDFPIEHSPHHQHVKTQFIYADEPSPADFVLYVMCTMPKFMNFEIKRFDQYHMICRPYVKYEKKDPKERDRYYYANIYELADHGFDGAIPALETLATSLYQYPDVTFVPSVRSVHPIAVDGTAFLDVVLKPNIIDWSSGMCTQNDRHRFLNNDDDGSGQPIFAIYEDSNIKLAFPIATEGGLPIRKGVLVFGRYNSAIGTPINNLVDRDGNIALKCIGHYDRWIDFQLISIGEYYGSRRYHKLPQSYLDAFPSNILPLVVGGDMPVNSGYLPTAKMWMASMINAIHTVDNFIYLDKICDSDLAIAWANATGIQRSPILYQAFQEAWAEFVAKAEASSTKDEPPTEEPDTKAELSTFHKPGEVPPKKDKLFDLIHKIFNK